MLVVKLTIFACILQDVTDLFGADLPVEGGKGGEFAWRDGPFLKALKAGYWIVLDEVKVSKQISHYPEFQIHSVAVC